MAFTLSQAGMVMHWVRNRGPHWWKSALVNGLGAFVTGITVLVVLVAKFVEGAWITLLFIPLTIFFFHAVRRHYAGKRDDELQNSRQYQSLSQPPIAVVPIVSWVTSGWAAEFAWHKALVALHVEPSEHSELLEDWELRGQPAFAPEAKASKLSCCL